MTTAIQQGTTSHTAYAAQLATIVTVTPVPPGVSAAIRISLQADKERARDAIDTYMALDANVLHGECVYPKLAGEPDPHASAVAKAAEEAVHMITLMFTALERATRIGASQ